ncbi:MAG: universal stress protein [Proteobacteria bacterium]|nr:universal stress protein [Pseudomonadota bacterium]
MADILACVDASAYAGSVCDHAGWFASDPDVGVEVLHVVEGHGAIALEAGERIVKSAVGRLREQGVGPITSAMAEGAFVPTAAAHEADIVVAGKRSSVSDAPRGRLGAQAGALVHAAPGPVCLVPKLFLPIHRALILLDAEPRHVAALDLVSRTPRLAGLEMDLVVVSPDAEGAAAKGELARKQLGRNAASLSVRRAPELDADSVRPAKGQVADLVVVSRAVLGSTPDDRLERLEDPGLWRLRTPILVC